jgi:hypothetical protein
MIHQLEEDGQQEGGFGPDQGWSQSDQGNVFLCSEVETHAPWGSEMKGKLTRLFNPRVGGPCTDRVIGVYQCSNQKSAKHVRRVKKTEHSSSVALAHVYTQLVVRLSPFSSLYGFLFLMFSDPR